MRFEAKHQELKAYTNVSFNRKNVCLSVGKKFSFKFADFLLNFQDIGHPLLEDFKRWSQYPPEQLLAAIKLVYKGEIVPGKKVSFKGTDYSVGSYIVTENEAIIITNLLKTSDNDVLVVFKKVIFSN